MTVFEVPHDVMSRWRGETLWSDVREMLVNTEWPLPSQMVDAPDALTALATEARRSDSLDWVDRGIALRLVFWTIVWVITIALLLVVVQFGPPWAGNAWFGGYSMADGHSSRPSMVFFAPILILFGAIVVSMRGPRYLPSGQFRKARLSQLTTAIAALRDADFVWVADAVTVHNLPSADWLASHQAWALAIHEALPHVRADASGVQALRADLDALTTAIRAAQDHLTSSISIALGAGRTPIDVDRKPLYALLATVDEQCGRLEPDRRWLERLPHPFPTGF